MRTSTSNLVRAALKEAGYNQRRVSVRQRSTGSVKVEILDPSANVEQIESIAKKFESVDYCSHTQEVLSGGNTFVFIQVSDAVRAAWAAPYLEVAKVAIASVPAEETRYGYNVEVPGFEGGRFVIFRTWANRDVFALHYFADQQVCGSRLADQIYSAESLAINIGEKINALRNDASVVDGVLSHHG